MSIEKEARGSKTEAGTNVLVTVMMAILILLFAAACDAGSSDDASGDTGEKERSRETASRTLEDEAAGAEKTTAGRTEQAGSGEAAELARAEIGQREITGMYPADGEKPDAPQPLPENPPRGIEVYPATTNRTVEGSIEYNRKPPTNGNHAPLWQNCGFYDEPVQDRHAVHSMDHGVVWITHRPGLTPKQLESLRPYGNDDYVIVSPYPGQEAPIVATSWRVQLELDDADDPRLEQFVNDFRVSELAPLSGNRCTLGVGDPRG